MDKQPPNINRIRYAHGPQDFIPATLDGVDS